MIGSCEFDIAKYAPTLDKEPYISNQNMRMMISKKLVL